jgi:hypothetical protein
MNNSLEAKNLAHNILIDIENNKKDLHLLALQTARLALMLNNQEESKKFSDYAKESGSIEAFLNSYGLLMHELVKSVDLDSIYTTANSESYDYHEHAKKYKQLVQIAISPKGWIDTKKDPKEDIAQYNRYKKRKSDINSTIYEYAMNVYYQLNFSENVSGIFDVYRNIVDNKLPSIMPNSREKLDSITKNLQSQNQEDWSNAVHTCRKLLQDFADELYPPSNIPVIGKDGKPHEINKESYINRLIQYIENYTSSDKFKQITNSNIKYIGERLDAVYEAANKGSHETIATLGEARRYVIYTYLFIGDVLSLTE